MLLLVRCVLEVCIEVPGFEGSSEDVEKMTTEKLYFRTATKRFRCPVIAVLRTMEGWLADRAGP